MSIQSVADNFRSELIAHSKTAENKLLAAYATAERDIINRSTALLQQMQDNSISTKSAMLQLSKYDDLLSYLDKAINNISHTGASAISSQQLNALHSASNTVKEQIHLAIPNSFNRIHLPNPDSALRAMVGHATDGSPLDKLLSEYGIDAKKNIVDTLVKSIANGQDIRRVTKEISQQWGQGLSRSQALARTEIMRAGRDGARQDYLRNSDVVKAYRWLAARSARTCGACLASDGEIFQLSTPFEGHVNCRCCLIPVVDDDQLHDTQTGATWFEAQPEGVQKQILGNTGYKKYKDGTPLDDFIDVIEDSEWGDQRTYSANIEKNKKPKPYKPD